MKYFHKNSSKEKIDLPVGKVICIGRNYAAHAKELGNEVPTNPLFFMKPKTALINLESPFFVPEDQGEVQFETEIAVLLQHDLKDATEQQVAEAIWGFGIAFDLTLRDLQKKLKEKSQPWEKAKAFDGACPVSSFVEKRNFSSYEFELTCFKNTEQVQFADSAKMLWSISELIKIMSQHFTLEAGDVVLTGTPEGVGPLSRGDNFNFSFSEKNNPPVLAFSSSVN
jgi:2-keto-4-pentenoate hydratase/2-oxohepta-3-ene-1,7-dioic acid hydratase in catechol pathway